MASLQVIIVTPPVTHSLFGVSDTVGVVTQLGPGGGNKLRVVDNGVTTLYPLANVGSITVIQ